MRSAVLAAAVLGLGLTVLAAWIGRGIEGDLVLDSGKQAARFLGGFIKPFVRDLSIKTELTPATKATLESMSAGLAALSGNLAPVKLMPLRIWGTGGRLLYSNMIDREDQTFVDPARLAAAWRGEVAAELDDPGARQGGGDSLGVLMPVREDGSDRIIGVAEFHLPAVNRHAHVQSIVVWVTAIVGALSVLAVLLACAVLQRGYSPIAPQSYDPSSEPLTDCAPTLEHDPEFGEDVPDWNARLRSQYSDAGDRALRTIGADLHDGPAQLIGLALLRLDSIAVQPVGTDVAPDGEVAFIRQTLNDALREIRDISRGAALPESEHMSATELLLAAVQDHQRRTGTTVDCRIGNIPENVPQSIKTCLYRVVQEGLNNAYRHGAAQNQQVRAALSPGVLEVEILDGGPGFDMTLQVARENSMGLRGLCNRVEAVGGRLEMRSKIGCGTRLLVRIPVKESA